MTTTDDRLIWIYADESCLGNQFQDSANPGAAAGLIETFDARRGWRRKDYYHFDPDTTNNRMALTSAIVGLRALNRPCDIVFTTDSQYLARGMTDWIHGWARRGWRRKSGAIENLDLWRELASAAARHRIEWRWVRGHDEHVKNEYAHALAVDAARNRRSSDGTVGSDFDRWVEEQMEKGRFTDFLDVPPHEQFRPQRPPPGAAGGGDEAD